MKPWMYFVLGGIVGVIGFMLILLFTTGRPQEVNFFEHVLYDVRPSLLRIYIVVWIFSGLGSMLVSRWNVQQRYRLLGSLIVSIIVGIIVGVMGLLFIMV